VTRRALALLLGLAAVAMPLLLRGPSPDGPPEDLTIEPSSAIVIVVDDMDDFSCADAGLYLPRSSKWLSDQGRCFEEATTASPVCCPARAMLMTGQLPHNNGVRRQNEADRLVGADTVQHDLGEAGVATYGTGKFLNGLDPASLKNGEFDSGFAASDFWNHYDYLTYDLVDEDGHRYTPPQQMHTTVRTGVNLRSYVADRADEGTPFFAYGAFLAPHDQTGNGKGALPRPTPANAGRAVPPFEFRPERDTRDKLLPFQSLDHGLSYYRAKEATRIRALYDVDDQVAALFELLEAKGLLDTTAVIFTSDNGYALGENGWEGKAVPYPASVDVPLLAYLPPGVGEPGHDTRPVDLVDIAPTVYDVFGVTPGHVIDGHSLLGDHVRTRGRVLEFANERSQLVLRESGNSPFRVPTWAALRIGDRSLVQYYRGGRLLRREYYEDPAMERNLLWSQLAKEHKPSWGLIRGMVGELKLLRNCAGTEEQGSANPCP
jgi:arylsulfatase A-like enzyme